MQILEQNGNLRRARVIASSRTVVKALMVFAGVAMLALLVSSCKKEVGVEAMDSDANGYVCLKCGAKLYTARTVFIGPKCPKCQEDTLMPTVGYYCEKDKHLTIRPQRGDTQPIICEICKAPLVNAMRTPREAELKNWGAVKAP